MPWQRLIKKCGTAQLVGYQLQWSIANDNLLVDRGQLDLTSATEQELDDLAPMQPMLLFCLNEVLVANSLMSTMKRNLMRLDLFLQGRNSGEIGSMNRLLSALANGRVPEEWQVASEMPVLSWISNFTARIRDLHLWAPEVASLNIPMFWLPHLHNPQGLFAALKLAAAAKEDTSLDHIQIEWEISKKPYASGHSAPFRNSNVGSNSLYSVSFGGLSLIGAQWSPFTQVLEDCDPKSLNKLPLITARAIFKSPSADRSLHQPSDAGFTVGDYDCPVYSDRACTRLLFSMKLKSLVHTAKWAMIGVHAVLSSDAAQQ